MVYRVFQKKFPGESTEARDSPLNMKMKKKYVMPSFVVIEEEGPVMLSTSRGSNCSCGCPSSDVYTGKCGCNNGLGCPQCENFEPWWSKGTGGSPIFDEDNDE